MNAEFEPVTNFRQARKRPIPTNVSAVAYITIDGFVRYTVTGADRELPKDFKEWMNKPKG